MSETEETVELLWVGYQGDRRSCGTVNAHSVAERSTLARQVWVVTDAAGRDLVRFVACGTPSRTRIRPRAGAR